MGLSLLPLRVATARPVVSILHALGASKNGVRQGPRVPAAALTFDDGPHPEWTPRVLDALSEAGARATFFVLGRHAAECPEVIREARRRGHEIGTHLYTHDRGTVRSDADFARELAESREIIEQAIGEPIRWLRFPYGERGHQRLRNVERDHGLRVAHWTASSHDSRLRDPAAIVARAAAGLRPGAILLFHDRLADAGPDLPARYVASRDASIAALPGLFRVMSRRGLAAVTMSELFGGK